MRATFLCILLATLASPGVLERPLVQEFPNCGSAKAQYTLFDKNYSARIQIDTLNKPVMELSTNKKVFSPQRTRWLIQIPPDTMKPGPWTTRVYTGARESGPGVELRFVDEENGGIDVRWLNEKLIFGEVWWGRIYATDFIFDVEQRKFIYREMAHFGELTGPCQ
jgi:hypothetical protein